MSPALVHEHIASPYEAKRFVDDVLERAASEIYGSSFRRSGADLVGRKQEIRSTFDEFAECSEVGFTAYRNPEVDKPDTIVYNIWVAINADNQIMPNPYADYIRTYESDVEDDDELGDIAVDVEDEDDEDDDIDLEDAEVVERTEFYLDSKLLKPTKIVSYDYYFEGEIVDSRNLYTNYEIDQIIGDTVDEQVLFEGTREALNRSFSSEDTRLMLSILGRLGLLRT
jgi:hypothetical protein